ncbi:MAG TPA: hypothetical protein VG889_14945 [Rhizomicrobium sp.]|nr:hypothetical protein [Rhizomicrobium sp.]
MRAVLLCCLGMSLASGAASAAAVLIPVVPVAGATATNVTAINDDGTIAGYYVDADGLEHAFFGPLDGKHYKTFDGGDGGTEARGINDSGLITGLSNSQSGDAGAQPIFVRNLNGKIVGVTRSGEQLNGYIGGMDNAKNRFAGAYWDPARHHIVAFLGQKGKWTRDVKIPQVHQASAARGINGTGTVVGSYFTPPMHGFVLANKTLVTVDYPSGESAGTELEAINDKGLAVGQWTDAKGHAHSFVYDTVTATFTDIAVKHAHQVAAWGINSQGAVAVATDKGSFIWCASRRACVNSR